MKRVGKIALAAMAVFLVAALLVEAYLIEDAGELWWDDPAVTEGSVEVLYDGDGPYLLEHVLVINVSDSEIVFEEERDTGIAGFAVPGSGLAISEAFTITLETDDFLGGESYQIRYCHRWEAENITSTIEFPVCLIPLDSNGTLVAVDDNCCWDGDSFVGTAEISVYLPLILREWGLQPPERP